jgi:hypothetical protein
VGVLGFVRLGQAAAKLLAGKREMILAAAADQKGYIYPIDDLNTHCKFT